MQFFLFQSLGGLGMFLFGMKIMSEGLQKVAGKKMRRFLTVVSDNRFVGCGVGALVTGIIQSSSATTVTLVGFVDAGLMTLQQAVGVILGANVGTTVTAQLIAFRIEAYALPAIAAGVAMRFFLGHRKWSSVGDALLGFGLVFFGLALMKSAFAPLRQNPAFISFFTRFQADTMGGILLCVLAGSILTMILQSSSATVGITIALASEGLLDFETSVALVLGDNIGTTITAELASIGLSLNAHRTARANTLFNVIGVILIITLFPLFVKLVSWLTSHLLGIGPADLVVNGEKPNISRYIANSHTTFNVLNACFFLAFLPLLATVATWLTPEKAGEEELEELYHIKHLDFRFIDTPSVSLAQARAEIIRMGEAVELMYDDVIGSLKERKSKQLSKGKRREDAIDTLQREITQFLVRVMQDSIAPEESREVASLMRMANNLERTGDAVDELGDLIERLIEENLFFSEAALSDYEKISTETREFLTLVVEAIRTDDEGLMPSVQDLENHLRGMKEEMKTNHIRRLQDGVCLVDPGLVLVDMLAAFERIGNFCYNVAQAVARVK